MNGETIELQDVNRISIRRQIRKTCDHALVGELAESMRAVGLLYPIRVRRDGEDFIVVDGERRLAAAKLLDWKFVSVICAQQKLSVADIQQRQLVANCQRQALKPLELAKAIDELMQATSWTVTEVAKNLGFSAATISRHRALLDLPVEIQARVANGKIPADTAYRIARVADADQQAVLAEKAANGQLTRDEADDQLKSNMAETNGDPSRARFKLALPTGSVTISGQGLTPAAVVEMLSKLVTKARKLRSEELTLDGFVLALRQAVQKTGKRKPATTTPSAG